MNQTHLTQNSAHSKITIHIEAFGAVERQISENLSFQFDSEIQIAQVLDRIVEIYPQVVDMLDRCACALGEDIVPRQTRLTTNSTLVLLSPVAGG